jgi:hypothetical protein
METGEAVNPVGTEGAVVSIEAPIKAAACIIQGAVDVAVAALGPGALTISSSPKLLSYVDLAVKPEPLLHDESEMQNPKRRSPAAVVVIVPLETLEDEPLDCACPSRGETVLMPLYSKR